MNKNFEMILKNNKELLDFVSELALLSKEYNKEEGNVVSNLLINGKINRVLDNKKFKKYFKNAICLPPKEDGKSKLMIIDINGLNWMFSIENKTSKLTDVSKVFSGLNLVIRHKRNKSIISKNEENADPLLDITNEELNVEKSELVYITKDTDLKDLVGYNINNFIFPRDNNVDIKESYEKRNILRKVFSF